MVNYSKGKIYKLVNSVDNEIYIGSSCSRLSSRKAEHKIMSKRKPNYRVYEHLNSIGWDNVSIILVENVNCQNREQLLMRERYYIDLLKPSLNKVIPLRTVKEYYEENKEKLVEQSKKYYNQNKEHIAQRRKQYYNANKNNLLEKCKTYREKNKNVISEKGKEKIRCCYCDVNISKSNISQHIKRNKHIKNYKQSFLEKFGYEFDGEITKETLKKE